MIALRYAIKHGKRLVGLVPHELLRGASAATLPASAMPARTGLSRRHQLLQDPCDDDVSDQWLRPVPGTSSTA